MSDHTNPDCFLVTKEHRRFVEFCDTCRRYRYIGLCYGAAGVGKTWSSRTYARWNQIEQLDPLCDDGMPPVPEIMACRTVFYTAPVTATARRIEKEVDWCRYQFKSLLQEMSFVLHRGQDEPMSHILPDPVELIIIDEADRLKAAGLEQLRDIYDRSQIGMVLIGMPGIEKRLSRYPQLYSRVGFVHHFKPLSTEELRFILEHKWQQLGLNMDPNDFTDVEAVTAIIRITGGNFRLVQRLLNQIERVMQINELRYVTKEVVESARELLVIGPS